MNIADILLQPYHHMYVQGKHGTRDCHFVGLFCKLPGPHWSCVPLEKNAVYERQTWNAKRRDLRSLSETWIPHNANLSLFSEKTLFRKEEEKTGRPKAIYGQRYPLPYFEWFWVGVRGSRAAALKGTKSCRTQGDFCSSCLKRGMRCYRGLIEGPQEPESFPKANSRPEKDS